MKYQDFFFAFFFVFLFTNGLIVIFHKYEMKQKLLKFGMKTKMKFFYDLSGCDFCIEHHLAILPTIILFLRNFCEIEYIILPFLVSSGLNLIKQLKK